MGSRLARLSTARHRDKSLLRGTLGSMRVDWGHPYGCILSRKVQNLYRQYRRSVFASAIHKNSKVPIVFCTAYASTKIRADVLKLGNTALTTRPSSRTCWLARLRSAFVTYLNTKGSVTKPWPPPRLCWRGRRRLLMGSARALARGEGSRAQLRRHRATPCVRRLGD